MDEKKKAIALFRFQVIAPLLALEGDKGALKAVITKLSERSFDHPRGDRRRIGFGTIEQWLYDYKKHGLDALEPKSRADRGKPRRIDDEVQNFIEDLAKDRPELTGVAILAEVQARFGAPRRPSQSTLYRALRAKGLDQRAAAPRKDLRAYAFDLPGDCWQADIMYGPSIATKDGKCRRTYLVAIIDDATRLICHAQFYEDQDLSSLKDAMKQAIQKRGVPRRFYFDNGKVFRSRLMLLIAARLGVHLIHARPYRPQGKGKIERWFRYVRSAFLVRLDTKVVVDLFEMNRRLFAWVEGEYHVRPHKGMNGETPLDRWLRMSEGIRWLPADIDVDQLFLAETHRRIAKDGTLTIEGRRFEAGPAHIGRKLVIRFDPFDLRRVFIVTPDGKVDAAWPVDLDGNRRIKRIETQNEKDEPRRSIELRSLEKLADKLENELTGDDPSEEAAS